MAYWFDGFFARPLLECPAVLPAGAVWRDIKVPFAGIGVRMASQGAQLKPDEARALLVETGLGGAAHWLYISYVRWAGRIDSVYGLGASDSRDFGPLEESDDNKVQVAYTDLMSAFGVARADALNFPPFTRGFWGE